MNKYTKNSLSLAAREKGHNKTFIKIMVNELFDYNDLKLSIDPVCTIETLKYWLDVHCNKPTAQNDLEAAAEYYDLQDWREYKMHSELLYWFILNLLKE